MTPDDQQSLHLSTHQTHCPYCGAYVEMVLDPAQAGMEYVEDCSVCCQPMRVYCDVSPDGDLVAKLFTE